MGILTTGTAVKNHVSPKMARELIDCNISNYVPFAVLGLSASSCTTPTPTSSSSSSQDSVLDVRRYAENPVLERSGSTSEELRVNPLHKPTETKNKNRNEGHEEVQSDHELSPTEPPGLGYRDTSSSFHELPMESRAQVEPGSGKHSVYTQFPKDPNCDICMKTKTKINMKGAKKYKVIYCMTCRIGCRSSERIWSMNVFLEVHLSLDIETLPVLLTNYQWSREQKWNRVWVSTVYKRTYPKL